MTTSRKLGLLLAVLLGASVASALARETGASDGDILTGDGRADCQHRIDLYDCYGDGWNGNTLDVLVNSVTVLSQITLPSGPGPLSFYFNAATGDTIQTIYYPIGGWPYEPYYMIYGGLGFLLGQDGGNCQQPTGITVIGNCTPLTLGACCVQCVVCTQESEPTCLAMGGVWLGENVLCAPLLCTTDYCWPGAETCDEYISRVQIGAIDNSSGCEPDAQPPNYADYTNLSTDVHVGADTSLVVTNGNPVWEADYCAVWIDWNRDCSIDSSERVGLRAGVGPYTFTIPPPVGAQLGWARMRIAISYYYTPDPCGLQLYGEVEDYALHIVEAPGACCAPDGTCSQALPSECSGEYGGSFTQCAGVDCNSNGADDFCDITNGASRDCNWNGILDECDIANGTSLDCQPDGIPDECEVTPGCGWQIDDGMSESTWGLPDAGELCWMNHMFAPSWDVVGHIAACFGSPSYPGFAGVVAGQSFRVYVWSDPNQDGNPLDAVFLGEATGTVEPDSIDTDVVQMVTISPPIAVNGSFFIGASVVTAAGGRPAPADDDGWTGPPDQGFLTFNSVPFDPSNIAANLYPMSALGYPLTVFLLQGAGAFSSDCNHNGRPDECDVPPPMGNCEGPDCSQDCQPNGIPDECEPDCQPNGRPDDCDIASGTSLDCQPNGIPDECDIDPTDPDENGQVSPDCQPNGIPDECDIASGTSQDCNNNGIPDECDIANCPPDELWCCDCQGDGIPDGCQLWTGAPRDVLQWDDGSSEGSLGLTAGGELCWMVHFTTPEPSCTVTGIKTCFGTPLYPGASGVSAGQPVRVYVWNDPNGDGNPTDAAFLGEATAVVNGSSIDSDVFQTVAINQPINGSFFIGASVVTSTGYPAPMDEHGPQYNQAWVTFNVVPFDPTNLASLYNMTDIGYPCNWLLRAEISCGPLANDCNGNQIPDECDIGVEWGGPCYSNTPCFPWECESDWNHNGIPDSCEPCGDLDSDGDVDLDDYWMFLDAFGSCIGQPKYNAAADLDGDGCVTLVDYQAWRMCYLMANGKEFVAPKPKPMPAPAKKSP